MSRRTLGQTKARRPVRRAIGVYLYEMKRAEWFKLEPKLVALANFNRAACGLDLDDRAFLYRTLRLYGLFPRREKS